MFVPHFVVELGRFCGSSYRYALDAVFYRPATKKRPGVAVASDGKLFMAVAWRDEAFTQIGAIEVKPTPKQEPPWRTGLPAYTPDNSVSVVVDAKALGKLLAFVAEYFSDDAGERSPVTMTIGTSNGREARLTLAAERYGCEAFAVMVPMGSGSGPPPSYKVPEWFPKASGRAKSMKKKGPVLK